MVVGAIFQLKDSIKTEMFLVEQDYALICIGLTHIYFSVTNIVIWFTMY